MLNLTRLHLLSLQVSDLEKSRWFYSEILNFKIIENSPPDSFVFEQNNGATFVIRKAVITLLDLTQPGSGVAIWFAFEDLYKFRIEYFEQITIVRDIHDTPFGQILVIADPDGYPITLHKKKD